MKFIIKNGLSSKYAPINSRDSLLLSLHNKMVDGVMLNLNFTKDKEIVIYHNDNIFNKEIGKADRQGELDTVHNHHTLEDIKKYNLGNRVKRHQVISLKEALELFKDSNKVLIFNLSDYGSDNLLFSQYLTYLVRDYQNIYIQSSSQDMLSNLKNYQINAKLGTNFENEIDGMQFYTISNPSFRKPCLEEMNNYLKIDKDDKFFLFDEVDSDKLIEFKEMFPELEDYIYICSSKFFHNKSI